MPQEPALMNPLDLYRDCGRRAAVAMSQRDTSRYVFERRWFREAKAMENAANHQAVQAAYDEGYEANSNRPRPDYFR